MSLFHYYFFTLLQTLRVYCYLSSLERKISDVGLSEVLLIYLTTRWWCWDDFGGFHYKDRQIFLENWKQLGKRINVYIQNELFVLPIKNVMVGCYFNCTQHLIIYLTIRPKMPNGISKCLCWKWTCFPLWAKA